MLCAAYDPDRLIHEETRGCIFDRCAQRKDIAKKLESGQLCAQCQQGLELIGAPLDAFFAFCAHIPRAARRASLMRHLGGRQPRERQLYQLADISISTLISVSAC